MAHQLKNHTGGQTEKNRESEKPSAVCPAPLGYAGWLEQVDVPDVPRERLGSKWAEGFETAVVVGLAITFAVVFSVAFLKWIPDWIRYEYGPDIFTALFHPSRTEQIKRLRVDLATSQRELDLREADLAKLRDDAEVGKRIKGKSPRSYDNLTDAEVGLRLRTNHPGAYDQVILENHPQAAQLEEQILKLRVALYRAQIQLEQLGEKPALRLRNPYRQ